MTHTAALAPTNDREVTMNHIALIGNTEVQMGDIVRVQGKPYVVVDEPIFHTYNGVRRLRWALEPAACDNPGIARPVWDTDPQGNAILLARG